MYKVKKGQLPQSIQMFKMNGSKYNLREKYIFKNIRYNLKNILYGQLEQYEIGNLQPAL